LNNKRQKYNTLNKKESIVEKWEGFSVVPIRFALGISARLPECIIQAGMNIRSDGSFRRIGISSTINI
jgi:hypothetical protein